jgi:glycosyltransferase involved in cell wall biosynthesis
MEGWRANGGRVITSLSFPLLVDEHRAALVGVSRAREIIRDFRPDCVHVNSGMLAGRAAVTAARELGIPVMGTNHLMPENILRNLSRGLKWVSVEAVIWQKIAKFYNQCDWVTAPSRCALDLLIAHGLDVSANVITNGVDLARFGMDPLRRGESNRILRLGYLGRVNREKDVDTLIRCIPRVRGGAGVSFVIGGTGNDLSRLRRLASRLRVDDRVQFVGHVPESVKISFLQGLDMFVMPSSAELQSIATMEAMACGLPVIGANISALPELCHDGDNGALYDAGDPLALATAINRVLDEPDRLAPMGAASRRLVERWHDHKMTVDSYEHLYERLVATTKPFQMSQSTSGPIPGPSAG